MNWPEMDTRQATIDDLVGSTGEGWRTNGDGRRIRSRLDPVRLVSHFRRIGAAYSRLRSPTHGTFLVNRESLLPLLWLALAERGWEINRRDAEDAWYLASVTPQQPRR